MKLLFFTFAPLRSNAGHLARFSWELYELAKLNEIIIVCLGKEPDNEKTKNQYRNIIFLHLPVQFIGWNVNNLTETVKNITSVVQEIYPDLCVLQMEVWDLMRELGRNFRGKIPFSTVVHAMPFLGSPEYPSGNFEQDVIEYAYTQVEQYRREYILEHYREAEEVFKDVSIIANNRTVAFYLGLYFKNVRPWALKPSIVVKRRDDVNIPEKPFYDFIYMARMEAGKGVEYLEDILKRISLILSRPINVALLGEAEDIISKNALHQLLINSKQSKYFNVDYIGWADDNIKRKIFSNSGVFIYPSHYDNFPTVLNEALAFGLPSVTWDVPFARLNYLSIKAVKQTPFLDFQQFAENAVMVFQSRKELSIEALNFVKTFDSVEKLAQFDSNTFKEVSKHNYE